MTKPDDRLPPGSILPWLEHPLLALVFSLLVVTACVLLDWVLHPHVSESDLVMVLLVGVLLVARLSTRAAAVLAAVLGVAAFDVVFVEPRFTLAVAETRYLLTFAVMAAMGLVLATTTARLRRQARRAWARSMQLRALNDLAQALVGVRDPDEVVQAVHEHVMPALGVPVVLELQPDATTPPDAQVIAVGAHARLIVQPGARGHRPEDAETLHALAGQLAVTLQRISDANARQAAELAAERERLRNALLSSVSHDLRTPLGSIVGAASTLLQDDARTTPHARTELLQTIRDETDRLARLLDNLLHMTRIEGGGVIARRDWEAPEELAAAVLERVRPRAEGHLLRARIAPDPALVPCDAMLIELALLNLLENAMAHTPPGTAIELRGYLAGETYDDLPGEVYVLEVSDDGPGVPEAERERIFDKFVRADRSRGVGLGLSICRAAARAHGGDAVAVASEGGKGLTVRVIVPYEPAPLEPAPNPT